MLAFSVVILPLIAQAQIISLVSGFFLNKTHEPAIYDPNSQKISLLLAPVSPHLSVGGGDIVLIDDAILSETGPSNSQANLLKETGQISTYLVEEGDTLSEIADMFDVSLNTIRWGNNIKGSNIQPGQSLVILPISGVRHTVKSGETLAGIAKLYKGDTEEIYFYNNISGDTKLTVGEEIIIPNGILAETSPSSAPKKVASQTSSNVDYSGYYLRPIPLGVGRRTQGIHGYNGVDIASSQGTDILASASGVVEISRFGGWNGGYGNYIVISHPNGTQTLYAHTSKNFVKVGEQVSQGEVIAEVGSTGQSTGPHVHFEVRGAQNPF